MNILLTTVTVCLMCYVTGSDKIVNTYCNCNCPGGTRTIPGTTTNPSGTPQDHTHAPQDHTHPTPDHTHSPQDHNHTTQLVAFSVGSSNSFAPTSTTRIPMNVMNYNDGGYFHADNSFHVPVKGVYEFSFSARSQQSKWASLYLYTRKTDGTDVNVAQADGSGDYSSVSGSVIFKVDVGETVSVWLGGGGNNAISGGTPPRTLFSGKLLYKLD